MHSGFTDFIKLIHQPVQVRVLLEDIDLILSNITCDYFTSSFVMAVLVNMQIWKLFKFIFNDCILVGLFVNLEFTLIHII